MIEFALAFAVAAAKEAEAADRQRRQAQIALAEQRRRDEAFRFAMRNYKPVYRFDGTSWIIDQARTDAAFEEAKRKCEVFAEERRQRVARAWCEGAQMPTKQGAMSRAAAFNANVTADLVVGKQKPRPVEVTKEQLLQECLRRPRDMRDLIKAFREGRGMYDGRPAVLVDTDDLFERAKRLSAAKRSIADLRIRHEHLMANVAAATREFDARPNPTECRRADGALRWRVNDPMHARRAVVAKARSD